MKTAGIGEEKIRASAGALDRLEFKPNACPVSLPGLEQCCVRSAGAVCVFNTGQAPSRRWRSKLVKRVFAHSSVGHQLVMIRIHTADQVDKPGVRAQTVQ